MLSVCRTQHTNVHTAPPAAQAPETADSSNGPLQLHRRTAAAATAAAALLLLQGNSGTCLHHSARMRCKPKEVQGSTFPPCTPPAQTDAGQGSPQVAPCPTPRQQGQVPLAAHLRGGPVCRETQSVEECMCGCGSCSRHRHCSRQVGWQPAGCTAGCNTCTLHSTAQHSTSQDGSHSAKQQQRKL
jgi:hypothetical protein